MQTFKYVAESQIKGVCLMSDKKHAIEGRDPRHPFDQVEDAIRRNPNIVNVLHVRRDVMWEMTNEGMRPYTGPEYDLVGVRITPPDGENYRRHMRMYEANKF